MNVLHSSLKLLWSRKLLWLEETLLLAAVLAGIYGWLGLPVASAWLLGLHVLAGLAIVAVVVFGCLLSRRMGSADWRGAVRGGPFWLAVGLCLIAGFAIPYWLVWWIPNLEGMTAQAISALVRFAAAGLLFTGSLLWLRGCAQRKE